MRFSQAVSLIVYVILVLAFHPPALCPYWCRKSWGAFHYAKDSWNFGQNSNGKIRFVFFWPEYSGSPLEVVHIFRSEYSNRNWPFHFWQTGSLPLLGNSVTKFKMTTAISIGWPDLIGKCRSINSILLRYSRWSLTSQFGIMESTLDDDDFTPRGGGNSLLKRSGVLVVPLRSINQGFWSYSRCLWWNLTPLF